MSYNSYLPYSYYTVATQPAAKARGIIGAFVFSRVATLVLDTGRTCGQQHLQPSVTTVISKMDIRSRKTATPAMYAKACGVTGPNVLRRVVKGTPRERSSKSMSRNKERAAQLRTAKKRQLTVTQTTALYLALARGAHGPRALLVVEVARSHEPTP